GEAVAACGLEVEVVVVGAAVVAVGGAGVVVAAAREDRPAAQRPREQSDRAEGEPPRAGAEVHLEPGGVQGESGDGAGVALRPQRGGEPTGGVGEEDRGPATADVSQRGEDLG